MKTHLSMAAAVLLALSSTLQAQGNAAAPAQTEMQKWIAATDAQWQAAFKREVTDVYETELGKLKIQYLTSLDTAITKASGASDLDGALALRNEQKRFAESNVFAEQDIAAESVAVKQVRVSARAQLARLDKDRAARAKALHAKYDQALSQAQSQLTQSKRLDDALLVKNKRGEVAAAWITPGVAAAAENPAATEVARPTIPATKVPFGTKSGTAPVRAGAAPGFINLLPMIDPDKNAVAGKWTMQDGALVSSGTGEERLEIPYEAPAEYDFQITFTKKTGKNCVIQILTGNEHPIIWVMSVSGMFTFHYVKGAGIGANRTTVKKPAGLKDNHRYISLVKVRKNGAEAFLDGKLITKWETDFSDSVPAGFWALRNQNCLGVAAGDSKVIYHSIEVREISGPGKMLK